MRCMMEATPIIELMPQDYVTLLKRTMRKMIIAFYCLTAFLLCSCSHPKTTTPLPPTRTPLIASDILAGLNRWNANNLQDVDVALCSNRHPNREPSGETRALITESYRNLKELGLYVRWNCATQSFEITTQEDQKSRCDCP